MSRRLGRLAAALGALLALSLAAAPVARGEDGAPFSVHVRFMGGCAGAGLLRGILSTPGGQLVEEHPVTRWDQAHPIEFNGGIPGLPDEFRLQLVEAGTRRVLFDTIVPPTPDELGEEQIAFRATLDCSTVPYRQVLPETSMETAPPSDNAGLTLAALIAAAVVGVLTRRFARRLREEALDHSPGG